MDVECFMKKMGVRSENYKSNTIQICNLPITDKIIYDIVFKLISSLHTSKNDLEKRHFRNENTCRSNFLMGIKLLSSYMNYWSSSRDHASKPI